MFYNFLIVVFVLQGQHLCLLKKILLEYFLIKNKC